MKHINYIISTFLIIILVLNISCSDEFLEVTPKGVVLLESTNDYDLVFNGSTLGSGGTAAAFTFAARSVDACAIEPHYSSGFGEADPDRAHFEWTPDGLTLGNEEDGFRILQRMRYLQHLYLYNKIINEVLESSGGSEAFKNELRAEAMASRALIYFKLINWYAQPYNSATASSDLGFPIITESDVNLGGVTRASTQEVYDFIINDLTTAIPLLKTSIDQRLRMSKGAAQALLGEVYVYMNRYDEALLQLNDALTTLASSTAVPVELYDYNVTTLFGGVHSGGFFGPNFVDPSENTEGVYVKAETNFYAFAASDILLSPETSALFGASDLRLSHWFVRTPFRSFTQFPVPGAYRITGRAEQNTGVALPKIYLLMAECKARTNDLSGAIADLEFLRRHRMDPADAPVPTGLSQDELIKFVFDERAREFALTGQTWFDTRRVWNDPLFQDKKPYTHTRYNEDGSVESTFTLTEERLVLQFSEKFLQDNPDLSNNP
ncbi:RagB/SusD family nutrient uptake outer membrane protein [Reichenbachiella sp.]|uniref:RagB/SusD family nutrient uptake outer membrane protein n=1 Tax=Reichenbachiella sp. TaxID=2184521 RepID=UPI0032974BB0